MNAGFLIGYGGRESPVLNIGAPAEDVERAIRFLGISASVTGFSNASSGYNYSITVTECATR